MKKREPKIAKAREVYDIIPYRGEIGSGPNPEIGKFMKTIKMEIDDDLLAEVERTVKALGTTRSEFICNILKRALQNQPVAALEKQHQEGYEKLPLTEDEVDEWETERVWGNQ